jgi:hypothetical protein
MPLTNEQLADLEYQSQVQKLNHAARDRLELVRLAKETLLENARSKPVETREVTAEDILTFANKLTNFVHPN